MPPSAGRTAVPGKWAPGSHKGSGSGSSAGTASAGDSASVVFEGEYGVDEAIAADFRAQRKNEMDMQAALEQLDMDEEDYEEAMGEEDEGFRVPSAVLQQSAPPRAWSEGANTEWHEDQGDDGWPDDTPPIPEWMRQEKVEEAVVMCPVHGILCAKGICEYKSNEKGRLEYEKRREDEKKERADFFERIGKNKGKKAKVQTLRTCFVYSFLCER